MLHCLFWPLFLWPCPAHYAVSPLAGEPANLLASLEAAGSVPLEPANYLRAPQQSVQVQSQTQQQRYWVSVGFWSIDQDVSTGFDDGDSDEAVSVEFGIYNWTTSEMGLGLEFAYQKSTYEVDTSSLAPEEVDATRYMAGIRLADTQGTDRWLYWAHGGLLYREDEGNLAGSDDGLGFYAGIGVEFRPVPALGIGPEVFYSQAESFDAKEWQFGLKATLHL